MPTGRLYCRPAGRLWPRGPPSGCFHHSQAARGGCQPSVAPLLARLASRPQPSSTEESCSVASKILRAQAGSRLAARGGLALMGATAALLLAGCASSPATTPTSLNSTAPEPGTTASAQQDTWPNPIVFAWRTASHQGSPALGAGDTQGRPVAFKSAATPAVAAALSQEMARAGVNVVPVGTPNAIEIDVQLRA